MKLSDFHFDLPAELIAKYPLETRSASRLLCVDGISKTIAHQSFRHILDLIHPGDLLVFNNTKVIPARFYGKKRSGGRVEVLVERLLSDDSALVQMRVSKSPRVGEHILLANDLALQVLEKQEKFYVLQTPNNISVLNMLQTIGEVPIPPYLRRKPSELDKERYQTIYAKFDGSVAAPTAGLHFDAEMFQNIAARGINVAYLTLHIGAGTFLPVRTSDIKAHKMHTEFYSLSENLCQQIEKTKAQGGRIIAVGTTSLRALESAAKEGKLKENTGETNIFIYPGFEFSCVDALITNLHLPCSTLLMLVAAFCGHELVMRAYQIAVEQQYRFYSYGDAMWLTRANT